MSHDSISMTTDKDRSCIQRVRCRVVQELQAEIGREDSVETIVSNKNLQDVKYERRNSKRRKSEKRRALNRM